jgi:hypothetical protein
MCLNVCSSEESEGSREEVGISKSLGMSVSGDNSSRGTSKWSETSIRSLEGTVEGEACGIGEAARERRIEGWRRLYR